MMDINGKTLDKSGIYTDFSGLHALRAKAKQSEEPAIRSAAQQLEGVFLQMMLKSMRQANEALNDKGLFNSKQTKFYADMFDQQLSLHLAGANGLGLADVLVAQMKTYSTDREAALSEVVKQGEQSAMTAKHDMIPRAETQSSRIDKRDNKSSFNWDVISNAVDHIKQFASPQNFIETLYPLAEQVAQGLGLDAKMLISQSALETGWGQHILAKPDGESSFNLFGIKADSHWPGKQVAVDTREFRDGKPLNLRANFRAYHSFLESFKDYIHFLADNSRYAGALNHATTPEHFIDALQDAGYATDPQYASKIKQVYHSDLLNNALKRLGL